VLESALPNEEGSWMFSDGYIDLIKKDSMGAVDCAHKT
jgi:hypothetical protein